MSMRAIRAKMQLMESVKGEEELGVGTSPEGVLGALGVAETGVLGMMMVDGSMAGEAMGPEAPGAEEGSTGLPGPEEGTSAIGTAIGSSTNSGPSAGKGVEVSMIGGRGKSEFGSAMIPPVEVGGFTVEGVMVAKGAIGAAEGAVHFPDCKGASPMTP